jgi:hypothetical protein
MEKTMECSEFRDDLMDVLYGEAPPAVAERYTTHVASCAACRDEMVSLRGVRQDLQSWGTEAARPPRRFLPPMRLPAISSMAAAAAIVMAFGGGLAVSRTLQVRPGEIAFRWRGGESTEVAQQLAKHEAAHQAEIQALKAQLVSTQPGGGAAMSNDDNPVLRRMQEMIQESEARQTMMLQASLNQVGQHAEAQRRYDLAQIAAGLSYLESKTGADIARTNKTMSDILRVSQPEGK